MSVSNYRACVAFVREQEGGNTDVRGDRGGRTGRGGITHTTYDAYRRSHGLPVRDVFLISDDEIAGIYRENYWNPIHGDVLPPGIDLAVFDYAINSGPEKALKARNSAGSRDAGTVIRRICAGRLSFVRALGSWRQFGAGWGRRVAACEATGLRMAGMPLPAALDAAKDSQSKSKKRTGGVIAAGAPAGAGAHAYIHHGLWVLAAIAGIVVLFAMISAFKAWRHGQRVDALGAAIKRMREGEAAAWAAKTAAAIQTDVEAKAIEIRQAALAAAKTAIGENVIPNPNDGASK